MAKKIYITDPTTDTKYTIEYDRDSVVFAESIGFDAAKAASTYGTDMVAVFRAGFHKHHPFVSKDVIYGIWDRISDKQGLFMQLMEMFSEPFNALIAEPEEGGEGNVTWVAAD